MRPRKCRLVHDRPRVRYFKPRGIPMSDLETVTLKDEEWEAILLADYRGLGHEAAAAQMGISRPTFSRVLASARRATATALAQGAALAIGGGDFVRVADDGARSRTDTPCATRSLTPANDGDQS